MRCCSPSGPAAVRKLNKDLRLVPEAGEGWPGPGLRRGWPGSGAAGAEPGRQRGRALPAVAVRGAEIGQGFTRSSLAGSERTEPAPVAARRPPLTALPGAAAAARCGRGARAGGAVPARPRSVDGAEPPGTEGRRTRAADGAIAPARRGRHRAHSPAV